MKLKEHVEPYYFIIREPSERTWSRIMVQWNLGLYFDPGSGFKSYEEAERTILGNELMYSSIREVYL